MKQVLATVVDYDQVSTELHYLRIHAPEIAAVAQAGQFVQVRCGKSFDPLLRRPLSLHRLRLGGGSGSARDEIALLFQAVGRGTSYLAGLRRGRSVDLLGPLGQGFEIAPGTRRLLLLAGGLGVAPLVGAAEMAIEKDISVTLLAGARTKSGLLPVQYIPPEVEYLPWTEDGSLGQRGLVTEALADYLLWADQVFVCGPHAMLLALPGQVGGQRDKFQISLEEKMACGVGACLGCVVQTCVGSKRVCRDGPVFAMKDLVLS